MSETETNELFKTKEWFAEILVTSPSYPHGILYQKIVMSENPIDGHEAFKRAMGMTYKIFTPKGVEMGTPTHNGRVQPWNKTKKVN